MHGDALTTKEAIKDRLGITSEDFDDLLDSLILAVTARIQTMCGRRFIADTHENEIHDGSDVYGSSRTTLILKNAPVSAISSIEQRTGMLSDPTWVTVSADSYFVTPQAGLVTFPAGIPYGQQNIRVTYTAGWDEEELPSDIVEVAQVAIIRKFKKRDSEGKTSESFQESSITWMEDDFTKDERATIKNYRRGYNI